jgi:hypothetical protein
VKIIMEPVLNTMICSLVGVSGDMKDLDLSLSEGRGERDCGGVNVGGMFTVGFSWISLKV